MKNIQLDHQRVEGKLKNLLDCDHQKMEKFLNDNGYPGRFWMLRIFLDTVVDPSNHGKFKCLTSTEIDQIEKNIGVSLSPDYREYVSKISNGGLASLGPIEPMELSDDLSFFDCWNFPNYFGYKVPESETQANEFEDQYLNGKGFVFASFDNGDDLFVVFDGHIPGSVWKYNCDQNSYSPVALTFFTHLKQSLDKLENLANCLLRHGNLISLQKE